MRNVLERPLQLARVQVEAVSCLPAVAWERGSNLLAVPVVAGSGTELAVAIIDPESRQVDHLDKSVPHLCSDVEPPDF